MAKRKKSQKWILEHYECEGQLTIDDFDVVPASDRFVEAYDPQNYYDMTHFEPEDLCDYDPCAECYPRTEEGCKHCYVNGG